MSNILDRSMNTPAVYLLFSKDSVTWSTNCTTAWSVECRFWDQIFQNIKHYFRASICTIDYTLCTRVFWKGMGAQILVYSYLRHCCPHPYKLEWPVLFLSRLKKHPFQLRDETNILKFYTSAKAFFNYIITHIVIARAFTTFQRM